MSTIGSLLAPVVLEPLPDELLANYLHRSALWNGYSTFLAFAQSLTKNRPNFPSLVDIFHPTPLVIELLAGLGLTGERALLELTTLAYWRRFEAANLDQKIQNGSQQVKIRSLFSDNANASLARFIVGKQSTLRACPVCLATDRIPYFRRSHQLPLTRCCYLHECDLILTCPTCGATPGSAGLPESASRYCVCGHLLANEAAVRRPHADCWLRLSRFNHDALHSHADPFESNLIRTYLTSRFKADRPLRVSRVLPFLLRVYGEEGCAWIMKGWQHAAPKGWHYGRLVATRGKLRAPQICAAFAQLDLSFAATLEQYRADADRLASKYAKQAHEQLTITPSTVLEARRLATELSAIFDESRTRNHLSINHRKLHWFLLIRDHDWYVSNFRHSTEKDKPIPSIESDREALRTTLLRLREQHATKVFRGNENAFTRAMIRDSDWLNAFRQADQAAVTKAIEDQHHVTFSAARDALIAAPGRPQARTLTALARAAGMTRKRAASLFKKYPSLHKYREESRDAFIDRVIAWGVPEALRAGQHLTATAITVWLGLWPCKSVVKQVRDLMSELQCQKQ